MNKKELSERDICTKFITPAVEKAGWNIEKQIREEVTFTKGRIYVKGRLTSRGKAKRADYILYFKHNIPIAVIEAKDNKHSIDAGMQQALEYSDILDIPFVFSSNGDGFLFHDKTALDKIETILDNDSFPSPDELWNRYKLYKGFEEKEKAKIIEQDYHFFDPNYQPRYYQQIAINRTIEAIAKGQNRILLVMATGTGKTYVAFQIAYRLWKSKTKKRILFLADRNALIDQAARNDFKHFGESLTKVKNHNVDTSYELYLALYQGLTGNDEERNIYKQFSPEFFDLIIVDECHRGSAKEDSAWREILEYFKGASQIGLTATPKETKEVSNIEYFDEPIYTYSLKQGIDDGFLAPYRVLRIGLNIDLEGWRPEKGKTDIKGNVISDKIYNRKDYDRTLVVEERTRTVAKKVTEFLKGYDRFAKTIIFCVDIDHASRMRKELVNFNSDLVTRNHKYVMQITGDNNEGKMELDNFTNPEEAYPVIATTSELMTTGIDAQTCKVIVLDSEIQSMTKFKQIIGRGTRIREDYNKLYFTILDFRNVTDKFADKDFDGDPVRIKPISEDTDLTDIIDEEQEESNNPIDEETGEEIEFPNPLPEPPLPEPPPEPRKKVYVNGVDVSVLISRELHFDNNGKPITISLKDYTKEIIKGKYASLDQFLNTWNESDRKEAIIKELEEQGIPTNALIDAVNREVDLFDIICHVAFDQLPLTRKERANNVKKRNYFTKYGEQTRKVLEALLDKYADEGITNLESIEVLKTHPFEEMGSLVEIIKQFGTKENYLQSIKELEDEIYKVA